MSTKSDPKRTPKPRAARSAAATADRLAAATSLQAVEKRALQAAEQKVLDSPTVQRDLNVLPERIRKEEDLFENETANAVFTMLGPLGEIPEAAYDILRDINPTLAVAKPVLEIATPILKAAAAQKQMMTVPGAVKIAAPAISQKLNAQGLPVVADLVTDVSNAPNLNETLTKLASKNGLKDAAGNLTAEAAHAVADEAHAQIKQKLTEVGATAEQHAVVDAAHQALKASAPKPAAKPAAKPAPTPTPPPPLAKVGGRKRRTTRRRGPKRGKRTYSTRKRRSVKKQTRRRPRRHLKKRRTRRR